MCLGLLEMSTSKRLDVQIKLFFNYKISFNKCLIKSKKAALLAAFYKYILLIIQL